MSARNTRTMHELAARAGDHKTGVSKVRPVRPNDDGTLDVVIISDETTRAYLQWANLLLMGVNLALLVAVLVVVST